MMYKSKKILCTLLCLLIAVAPHLFTVFSMMHTYAGMALLCILIAYSLNSYSHIHKKISVSFALFFFVSLLIDAHLINASIQSGKIGKNMAMEAIQKTGTPVDNVYVITIEDDYPKLSSFCVIPVDAFGWGLASKYETNYHWPVTVQDTTLERTPDAINKAKTLGNAILSEKTFECVWIVDHEKVEILR